MMHGCNRAVAHPTRSLFLCNRRGSEEESDRLKAIVRLGGQRFILLMGGQWKKTIVLAISINYDSKVLSKFNHFVNSPLFEKDYI